MFTSVACYASPGHGAETFAALVFLTAVLGLSSRYIMIRVPCLAYAAMYVGWLAVLVFTGEAGRAASVLFALCLAGAFCQRRWLRWSCMAYGALYLAALAGLVLLHHAPPFVLFFPFLYASVFLYVEGVVTHAEAA